MERYVHDAVLDMQIARDELMKALAEVGADDWGRFVPYGTRTLHDLLAHLAGADQAWAVAAQGLLRGEGGATSDVSPPEAAAARERAIERGRNRPEAALLEEMERRRRLLLGLYELLEPRHLALALRSYGDSHNSVRERIWRGYHDRLHAADVRRALRLLWHPPRLEFLAPLQPAADALSVDEALYVIYSVDPVCWERPSIVPDWTNRDLLAHIATGDWVLQTHLRNVIEQGHAAEWPDVHAGNAVRLHDRRFTTTAALVEEYLSMRHETLLLLSQLKPKHLEQPIDLWWKPRPEGYSMLEYLLGFAEHERAHREQLRPAMKYATAGGGS
jgi:uncharacterized damage-inducible protein DinB